MSSILSGLIRDFLEFFEAITVPVHLKVYESIDVRCIQSDATQPEYHAHCLHQQSPVRVEKAQDESSQKIEASNAFASRGK